MAVADEQQTQQNNQVEAGPQYTIYGTNETYTGRVVNVGNRLFTTRGGNQNTEEDLPTMSPSNQESSPGSSMHSGMGGVSNFFIYSPEFYNHGPYYRTDNGQEVTLYSYLHTHTDGTIMTGRNMSDSGNLILADGSPSPYPTVVPVTLNVPQGGQAGNQNTNQQNQQNNMNNNSNKLVIYAASGAGGGGY